MAKNFDVTVKDKLYYSTGIPSIVWIKNNKSTGPVSVGAVGASATMLFKVVGGSTHIFRKILLLNTFNR